MLFAHARQSANFSFARQLLDAIDVADFVRTPDERDSLWTKALNLEQLQHRRMIFLEQFRLRGQLAGAEQLFQLVEHPLADAGNRKDLLRIIDDVFDLLGVILDRLRRIPVRTNAERVLRSEE